MNCLIIGIAGGTGSGKTTFTERLRQAFPLDVTVLYHDNYYKAQDDIALEDRKKANYDHPNQLDTDMLVAHIESLKAGEKVQCPIYDFMLHTRSKKNYVVNPTSVIIIEGILVFSDERLCEHMDMKIYVETDADERILRRVQRDVKERGREIDGIIEQYLATVKPMHYTYVEPTKGLADIVINGGLNDVAFDIVKTKIESFLYSNKLE